MNDSEHRFARRFVIGVTILTLAAGWGGAALIRSAFPGHYLSVFPYIPLGFLLWELLFLRCWTATGDASVSFGSTWA